MKVIGEHDKGRVTGVEGWEPDHGRAIMFGQLVSQITRRELEKDVGSEALPEVAR